MLGQIIPGYVWFPKLGHVTPGYFKLSHIL